MSPHGVPAEHQATGGPAVHVETPAGETVIRHRRWLYATTSTVLAVLMGPAVLDGAGVADVYRALAVERMPLDELLEAARQAGIDSMAEVELAVLEPSGRISFIQYDR